MKFLTPIGFMTVLYGLYLAFFLHSIVWYSVFLVGGFLLFEGINRQKGFSVLKNKRWFSLTWLIFMAVTIAVEIIGNYWLNLWDYPSSFNSFDYLIHVIIIGYPLTGFFGLEFFVFLERTFSWKRNRAVLLTLAAFGFGYLNEYPNTFAYEWEYQTWPLGEFLGIPILVSLLWIFLLIVMYFKKPFLSQRDSGKEKNYSRA